MTSFRNVEIDVEAPVATWPAEALEIALDRGGLSDWRRLTHEIRRSPWGSVARTVEELARHGEHGGVGATMLRVVARARQDVVDRGRLRWAARLRARRAATGLSMRELATLAGTSASRLSDYENARVSPTTDALARLEHAADLGTQADS